jgi:hypothetical protein
MTSVLTCQLILGIDKRNPLFKVYAEEDESNCTFITTWSYWR